MIAFLHKLTNTDTGINITSIHPYQYKNAVDDSIVYYLLNNLMTKHHFWKTKSSSS